LQRLLPQGAVPAMTDPSGRVVVAEVPLARSWVGRRISEVESLTGARVAFVTRLGEGMVPGTDTVYQDGDIVHVVTTTGTLTSVEQTLDQPPPAH
ncbi:MAG: TrkA C-terminal domain-containing protein, partial [Oryzihumus sp.]